MPTIRPRGNIQPGSYETPEFSIPDNVSTLEITCNRNNWPDTAMFEAEVLISTGGEFKRIMWLNDVGGDLFFDTGEARTVTNYKTDLPSGLNRVIKATYSTNERINSQFDVELT